MVPTPAVQFTRHERHLINQLAQVKRKRVLLMFKAVKRQRRKIKAVFLGSHHSEIVELSDSEPDDDVVFVNHESNQPLAVMVTSTATLTMPLEITDSIASELMPPTSLIASTSQKTIDREERHENQDSNVQVNTNKGFVKDHKKTNGKRKCKVRLPAPVPAEPQMTFEEALAQALNL